MPDTRPPLVYNKVSEGKGNFGFNARTEEFEDLVEAGVIDPAKVVRTALENAASVAAMLITTEAAIAEKPRKKTAMPAMPPGGMGGMGGMPGMGGMGGMGGCPAWAGCREWMAWAEWATWETTSDITPAELAEVLLHETLCRSAINTADRLVVALRMPKACN